MIRRYEAARSPRLGAVRREPARATQRQARDPSRLVGILAVVGPILVGALFAVGRGTYRRFYGPFGLRPEEVGLDESQIVAQAGAAAGLLLLLVVSWALIGAIQWRLVQFTQPLIDGNRMAVRNRAIFATAFFVPVAVIFGLPPLIHQNILRELLRFALLSLTAGGWFAMALPRDRFRGFVGGAVAMVVLTVIGHLSALFFAGAALAYQFGGLYILGMVFTYFRLEPVWKRLRATAVRAVVFGVTFALAVGTRGTLRIVLLGTWLPAMAAWYIAGALYGDAMSIVRLDRAFPGWRRLVLLATTAAILALAIVLIGDNQDRAARNAIALTHGRPGSSSPLAFFPTDTFPARLVPRGNDPLHLCGRSLVARLLGRKDGMAYVLLRPPGVGTAKDAFVLPLPEADYLVETSVSGPGLCFPST